MSFVISPNMQLIVPVVGIEPGPDYATDINSSLTLVDGHDHTPGRGVLITASALNINSNLTFNSNFATGIAGLTLVAQATMPPNNTIYKSSNDLFYVDGLGNNIRITQGGGVAGTPGSISNLVAPASATYVSISSTFVWQSDVGVAANMDAGAYSLRDISPNSLYALTLLPPGGLSTNYQIVLPTLPTSQKIVTLDNNGNMSAPYTVDGSTITIVSNIIRVAPSGITTTQLATDAVTTVKILDRSVTTTKIALAAVTTTEIAASTITASNLAFTPVQTIVPGYGLTGGGGGTNVPIATVSSPGAVGTYVMAYYIFGPSFGANLSFGTVIAGSSLIPCSTTREYPSAITLAGNWQLMGSVGSTASGVGNAPSYTSLWLRIN